MNIIEFARIDATKSILDDVVNRCPWLSIVMIKGIGDNVKEGGDETLFKICARNSDSIMDSNSIRTMTIVTIIEDDKISAIVGFDGLAYKLYSGHIGFLGYNEESGNNFFNALGKEFGECVLTTY